MDINELIAIVKKKLQDQIKIESINIEDKSFLHKNHAGNQKGKFHLKINLNSIEYKSNIRNRCTPMNIIVSCKIFKGVATLHDCSVIKHSSSL